MKRFVLSFVFSGFVFMGGLAFGAKDDVVYFREPDKKQDEKIIGKIEEESPVGIKLKPAKGEVKNVPALQIRQIEYGVGEDVVGSVEFRRPDGQLVNALKSSANKRAEMLQTVLSAFQALDANGKLREIVPVHRYLQFRIAQTMYYLALEDAGRRDAALAALKEYKSNFADGWEIVPAVQLLVSLQQDKGDIEAASKTYAELSELPGISPAMKLQSQLKSARLLLRVPKFREAEEKLKQVASAMPADDPQRALVDVYLIQSQIAQKGNLDGIDKKLQQLIQTRKDDVLRGSAHNALGDYYRAKGDDAQAFWEYCKVDMLYNQDKEEHAKALYYLAQLFDKPPRNNRTRAEDFLARLKSSQFDGTLYQRLAANEKKKE